MVVVAHGVVEGRWETLGAHWRLLGDIYGSLCLIGGRFALLWLMGVVVGCWETFRDPFGSLGVVVGHWETFGGRWGSLGVVGIHLGGRWGLLGVRCG